MYAASIQNPDVFWAKEAERVEWFKKWDSVKNTSFSGDVSIKWFEGAKLNVCYNCVDRHLPQHANDIALIWEPDEPAEEAKKITFQKLHQDVCRFANVLKDQGVKKGDRVTIYMPMIPEAVYAMLACARIGAIHSVVFGGFSADSIADRISDCESNFVITADEGKRGGKRIALKKNVDAAVLKSPVKKVIVIKYTDAEVNWNASHDVWYHEIASKVSSECPAVEMDAEDPLFILYTSGSTNKPKGVLHTTAGYLVYAATTHQYVFDYRPGEIYWCTADVGWITGHSYIVYGPLTNRATTVIFEGIPTYPTASRFRELVDRHQVHIFFTAPTAIRALERFGNEAVTKTSRKSIRLLGTVGEPINTEAWNWYYESIGDKKCPVIDTWWQTETGGICITPLPGATDLKPGSATLPFFGIQPELLDLNGKVLAGEAEGNLCLADSWPGQMRTVYKGHDRFVQTYFSTYPGKYFTGDGCKRDQDGYYWITGRVDDVLNVSGHRLGTAEIESSMDSHQSVVETAVVGYPHKIKGQGIYAFVTLYKDYQPSEELKKDLVAWVRKEIGPIASPDLIQFATALPKTRSGKIMRRILRKIAENLPGELGDTSTLADPTVVELLVQNRLNK
ncbi:acetate--CoA ligase [bacterium K02(2017)]|nr:acetate--CoA ligase [bacterium K02(2017)]